ncbi:MAG: zf-HC2 domain-containing protein, partial [Acidobacteria bacterium]|nr:zf-HC2 domain-containing protein [Acidobacteriota bacterium]
MSNRSRRSPRTARPNRTPPRVLAADGELSRGRAERLRRHLAGCWECRLRAQELEGAIAGFV